MIDVSRKPNVMVVDVTPGDVAPPLLPPDQLMQGGAYGSPAICSPEQDAAWPSGAVAAVELLLAETRGTVVAELDDVVDGVRFVPVEVGADRASGIVLRVWDTTTCCGATVGTRNAITKKAAVRQITGP